MRDLLLRHLGLLCAGVATFALMGAGQSLIGPSLQAYVARFDLSGIAIAGWLVSAQWIGSAVGVAVMFAWRGRPGPRVALAMMAAGSLGLAVSPLWVLALISAVVFGTGYGIATVVFNPRFLNAFGARGPSMLGLLNATFAIGAIGAPLIFVALGSQPVICFLGLAVLCAAFWIPAGYAGGGAVVADHGATGGASPFRLDLWSLGFGVLGIGIEASLIGLGPAALVRAGLAPDTAAQLLSAFFVAFLLARLVLVVVAHRVAAFRLFIFAMALAAAAGLGGSLLPPGPFFVTMGICAGLFFPNFFVTATRRMGNDPRVAPSIIASGLVGGIAAPVMLASLTEAAGSRGFFVILGLVAGLTTLAGLILRRRIEGDVTPLPART